MLTDKELLEDFTNIESDRVERKKEAADSDKIREIICALANDMPAHNKPGVIFIGQNDDLSCASILIDDDLLLRLSQLRDDGTIQPIPRLVVRKFIADGCEVAAIIVAPSNNPPVRFAGRVHIRVGPRRALATGQEEIVLTEKRQWGMLPFDAQPCLGANLADLDINRFSLEFLPAVVSQEVLAQNHRSTLNQLKALRLASSNETPTVSGMLFIGKSPLSWMPGAYIQFRRLAGVKLTDDVIDNQDISGAIPDQIRRVDEILDINIKRSMQIGGRKRVDRADYPIEALRQLFRNAIVHRTYEGTNSPVRISWFSDRIEIQSPGGLYGQVTPENIGKGATDYRNPTIAGFMVQLGFMEKFGVGLQIAKERLKENGNPELDWQIDQQHVLAIVRPNS
jgi:ATP-dependent DNA helicase RecG